MTLLSIRKIIIFKATSAVTCDKPECTEVPSYYLEVLDGPLKDKKYLVCEECFQSLMQQTDSIPVPLN